MGGGPYYVPQLRDPAWAGKFGIRNSKIGEWPSFVPRLRDYEGRPKRAGRRKRAEAESGNDFE